MGLNVAGQNIILDGTNLSVYSDGGLGGQKVLDIGNAGHVVRPQNHCWMASFAVQGDANGFIKGAPVKPTSQYYNVGGRWNSSTGYFTCSVAGKYLACMQGIASGSAHGGSVVSNGYFGIMKNGAVYTYSHWNHNGYWETVSSSAILDMAAGDTISFGIATSPYPDTNSFWYGNGGHGIFYITFLR